MAGMRKRRIKFALELQDGEQARTMEDLKHYFDINKIIGYYQDGKLLSWLEDRFYDDEADAIKKLSGDEKDLDKRLCHIFHVDYTVLDEVEDVETIAWRKERLERLKQFTANPLILDNVDVVAFDQDDLEEIMHEEDANTVYLCQNKFLFSSCMLKRRNMHYIGIGKNVEVVVKSNEIMDFDEKGIIFENIKLKSPEELLELGRKAVRVGAGKQAVDYYQILIDKYEDEIDDGTINLALKELASIYYKGELEKRNYERAFSLYIKAAHKDDAEAMIWIGMLYEGGLGVTMNKSKAAEWYTLAANAGDVCGMLTLGWMHLKGEGVKKDWKKASEWYRKAAESGYDDGRAMLTLGQMYLEGGYDLEQNYEEALYWFRHAAHEGNSTAMYYMGKMCSNGICVYEDYNTALGWYRKSAEAGNEDAIKLLKKLKIGIEEDDKWYLDREFLTEFIYLIQKSRMPFYANYRSGFSVYSCNFLHDGSIKSSDPKMHDIFKNTDLLGQSEILICVLEIRHTASCDGIAFTDQVMYVKGNVCIPYVAIEDVSVSGRTLTVATQNKKWDINCEMFNPAAIKLFLQVVTGVNYRLTREESGTMCEIYLAK